MKEVKIESGVEEVKEHLVTSTTRAGGALDYLLPTTDFFASGASA